MVRLAQRGRARIELGRNNDEDSSVTRYLVTSPSSPPRAQRHNRCRTRPSSSHEVHARDPREAVVLSGAAGASLPWTPPQFRPSAVRTPLPSTVRSGLLPSPQPLPLPPHHALWRPVLSARIKLYERGAPPFPDLLLGAPSPLRWHHQGLQDKIKIVGIDLADRPAWYKEKVYPENKTALQMVSHSYLAIEDIRQGKYVIVVGDEDRENEGDLIMGASKVTPEAMAFIVRHGTGIVCVTMKEDDLERLELPLMVTTKENEEKLLTAFTVSATTTLLQNIIEYLKEREEFSNLKTSYLVGIARSIDKQLFEEAEQKPCDAAEASNGNAAAAPPFISDSLRIFSSNILPSSGQTCPPLSPSGGSNQVRHRPPPPPASPCCFRGPEGAFNLQPPPGFCFRFPVIFFPLRQERFLLQGQASFLVYFACSVQVFLLVSFPPSQDWDGEPDERLCEPAMQGDGACPQRAHASFGDGLLVSQQIRPASYLQVINASQQRMRHKVNSIRASSLKSLQDDATKYFDFVVVGSGVAGLRYALEVSKHGSVAIITKAEPHESNTNYAQGGVSAVLCPSDSVVCTEGPEHVKELIAMGASFDHGEDGRLHLAREGGHSHNRIVHSSYMTGREIERALLQAIDNDDNISLFGHHFAIDLLTCQIGICCPPMPMIGYLLDMLPDLPLASFSSLLCIGIGN
ncbi:hypothetical protein ABZP36_017034 [Zizania latifolia]